MENKTLTASEKITAGTATGIDYWNSPTRVDVIESIDSIEIIYTEASMVTYTTYLQSSPEIRVFKIVFSCKDGKWNKSDRIYGKIISATDESYEF